MSEKEIAKAARKRKTSEPQEKTAAKKIKKSTKAAAEKKAESKDFVVDSTGELKPAKKKATRKTLDAPAEKIAAISEPESFASPELSAIAGSELAEAVQTIEEITENPSPAVKAPRKKNVAKKTKVSAPSSDTIAGKATLKKPVSKAIKAKPLETKTDAPGTEEKSASTKTAANLPFEKEQSPIFKELSEPKLPALPQENRARLQIQSPYRIFFYWSVKHNPFETLHRAFPANRARDYKFSIKLVNLNDKAEETYAVETDGSWWFNVNPNTSYRAEVGFSSPQRPFVRLMYSNTVETPRAEPSPNRARSTDFSVSANQFAEVLEAAGYAQDAVEVAVTGDARESSDAATQNAFYSLVGEQNIESELSELRSVLLALASGAALDALRGQISQKLFAQLETILRENAGKLAAEKVRAVLKENFEFEDKREEFLTPVFGTSEINFPRKAGKPKLQKLSPVSSLR